MRKRTKEEIAQCLTALRFQAQEQGLELHPQAIQQVCEMMLQERIGKLIEYAFNDYSIRDLIIVIDQITGKPEPVILKEKKAPKKKAEALN